MPLTCHCFQLKLHLPHLESRDNEDTLQHKGHITAQTVQINAVLFVSPHDEASKSASGLHAAAVRVGGLPLLFLDLDIFGPTALEAEEGVIPINTD